MEQEPLAEEKRKVLPGKQECEVQLTVSQGARTITLEDYSVRDYREVRTELRDLGLNVKEERVTDSILLTGYVVRTEPGVGTVLHEDDTVTIYISNGSDTVTVSVPDFKGLSEARALITLMEHDLNVGDVTYEKNWQTAGTVIGQSVDAWSSVPKYSEISFTVSGGPSYAGDGKTIPTEDDMKWTPVETPEPVVTPEPDNTWDDGNGSSDWTDDTNDDNSGWTDDSAGTVWEDNTGEDSGSTDDSWMDDTSGGTEEDNTSDDDNWWDLGWDWIRP